MRPLLTLQRSTSKSLLPAERLDRPLRIEDGTTAEVTPGQGPYYVPVWAWDPGEGTLAVLEVA